MGQIRASIVRIRSNIVVNKGVPRKMEGRIGFMEKKLFWRLQLLRDILVCSK